jgi:hypothetical protein
MLHSFGVIGQRSSLNREGQLAEDFPPRGPDIPVESGMDSDLLGAVG